MWVVTVALVVLYFAIGLHLEKNAHRHLRDPRRVYTFTPMLDPEEFTPEGNVPRQRSLRFWLWGGIALFIYVLLF